MVLIPWLSPWATRCRPLRGLSSAPEFRLTPIGQRPRKHGSLTPFPPLLAGGEGEKEHGR